MINYAEKIIEVSIHVENDIIYNYIKHGWKLDYKYYNDDSFIVILKFVKHSIKHME